jgi:hypothetical protein
MQTTDNATHAPPPPFVVNAIALHTYFSSASILGDRSPQGSIEDRHIFNKRTQYCRTCDGEKFTTKARDAWLERRAAFAANGYDIELYPGPMPEPEVCSTCEGKGAVNGKRVPSARPKGSSVPTGTIEFGEERLMDAAEATGIMLAVGRLNPRFKRALELYYGDCGEWCIGELGDRLFGVIGDMTEWGRKAVERGMRNANDKLRRAFNEAEPDWRHEEDLAFGPFEGLRELKLISTEGKDVQKARYEAAYTEAYELLVAASIAWDECADA